MEINETAASNLRLLARAGGPAGAWEPGDDICPPWWPRRWWPRRALTTLDVHDLLAADRVHSALTLLAATYQYSDAALVHDVQKVALAHIAQAGQVLAKGASAAWEPGDDICPPWPWWKRGPWPRDGKPQPDPWRELESNPMPGRARPLLDTLALLQAYNVAAQISDAGARRATTAAIGGAIVGQVDAISRALG